MADDMYKENTWVYRQGDSELCSFLAYLFASLDIKLLPAINVSIGFPFVPGGL